MEILDDELTKQSLPEDDAAIRKLNIAAYDLKKHIRNARTAIVVIVIITVAAYTINLIRFGYEADVVIEAIILIVVLSWSAWYVPKSPKVALLVGGGLWFLNQFLVFLNAPETFFLGIIFKVIVAYFFVRGVIAAFKFEKLRAECRKYGQELTVD